MSSIKFGFSQIEKETPRIVNYIYKTIQFASVAFGIIILYLPIPVTMQLHITTALLIGNKLLSAFCSMFGIPNPNNNDDIPENNLDTGEVENQNADEQEENDTISGNSTSVLSTKDNTTGITGQ